MSIISSVRGREQEPNVWGRFFLAIAWMRPAVDPNVDDRQLTDGKDLCDWQADQDKNECESKIGSMETTILIELW